MDLRHTRIERLRQFARSRGVEDSPSDLGRLIGKKANQVTNLLGGHSSFGEKVARSIEVAANLPTGWLDESTHADATLPADVVAAARQIAALPTRQREWMLQVVRDALDGLELAKADLLARDNGGVAHLGDDPGKAQHSVTQRRVSGSR